jgi:thiamine pyrophosphate-dependent acetolactate synthase large subunit-like protein
MAYTLDRTIAVPRLVGNPDDFLFVGALAGATRDLLNLTKDGPNSFALSGGMGATLSIGLGLALARKDRRVMVIAGDGDALMGVGSFATIAVMNPRNLSILVVDNGLYQETGGQATHTARGTDIEKMARGAGIRSAITIDSESDLDRGAAVLRDDQDASLVVLRVGPSIAPRFPRENDAAVVRARFRTNLGLAT